MEYKVLAQLFEALSTTSSRLEKTALLVPFLQALDMEDTTPVLYLLQGRVFPEGDDRHVGLAGKMVLKALGVASGYGVAEIEAKVAAHGDVGDVVASLIGTKRQRTLFAQDLTVAEVFTTLQRIAAIEGASAQDQKLGLLNGLLTSADGLEAKFIVRTVLEDLRVGIAEGTLRDALAYAFFTTDFSYNKENNTIIHTIDTTKAADITQAKERIKRALDLTNDFALVTQHIISGKDLADIHLHAGNPCRVMLARKEKTFSEAFARTGLPARIEYKYDGFRLQVHKSGEKVALFTRSLENVTRQFPDVIAAIREQVQAKACILDAEAIGYDVQSKQYRPFQHISKRIKRKYDIEDLARELPVEVVVFDILKHEDEDTIQLPLRKRVELLRQIITPKARVIAFADATEVTSEEEAQEFYQASLAAGNEGVMIKNLDAVYEPGGRVSAWIKMKPTMDELDLVIIGAEWGTGKRAQWMTSFTLAVQDDEGNYLAVGKVGTGLKELDEQGLSFGAITNLLEPLVIERKGQEVTVRPQVVLEIAYEEIQKSPSYESGYALRFPRVIRLREDRDVSDIATVDDIIDLFESQ